MVAGDKSSHNVILQHFKKQVSARLSEHLFQVACREMTVPPLAPLQQEC